MLVDSQKGSEASTLLPGLSTNEILESRISYDVMNPGANTTEPQHGKPNNITVRQANT